MKITLKQLKYKCVDVNKALRATPYGVAIDRMGGNSVDVCLQLVPRRTGRASHNLFVGNTKEADAFLNGMVTGVGICPAAAVDPEAQDGSDV